jgi:hypothetical protein
VGAIHDIPKIVSGLGHDFLENSHLFKKYCLELIFQKELSRFFGPLFSAEFGTEELNGKDSFIHHDLFRKNIAWN